MGQQTESGRFNFLEEKQEPEIKDVLPYAGEVRLVTSLLLLREGLQWKARSAWAPRGCRTCSGKPGPQGTPNYTTLK